MNVKNTLMLLLFTVSVYAYIHFYDSTQLGTKEKSEHSGRVFHFDQDKVDRISVKNAESKIELRRNGGQWFLDEPVKDRADADVIAQLFAAAEGTRSEELRTGTEKRWEREQLKEYGLSDVTTKVKFAGNKEEIELEFGKDAAVEGKTYARAEGKNVPLVVGRELKESVSRRADDFRDRRIFELAPPKVGRVSIKSGAGDLDLEKKNQHWYLRKPLRARGDDRHVGELISRIATAKIDSFMDKFTNLSAFGLDEPMGIVSFFEDGTVAPVVLNLGVEAREGEKSGIYGKVTGRDCVVLVPKEIATLIKANPNDLRDRSLMRVDEDIVDRITISDSIDGDVLLARSGEEWVRKVGSKDEAINVNAARRLLRDFKNQQVEAFVTDVASDLARYGLDQPLLKITLSSYASENTAETKAGDHPIVSVLFGKGDGHIVYSKLEEEPFIVAVPVKFVESIARNAVQWQPLNIYNNRAEDISNLEVLRDGVPPIGLVRDGSGLWKLAAGGSTVKQVNVQSLTNTLATLRAVRWVGKTLPEYRLEKPVLTVSFKVANGTAGQIVVGGGAPDNLTYAMIAGKNGTFVLSKPDLTALQLPLIERPVPASASIPAKP